MVAFCNLVVIFGPMKYTTLGLIMLRHRKTQGFVTTLYGISRQSYYNWIKAGDARLMDPAIVRFICKMGEVDESLILTHRAVPA